MNIVMKFAFIFVVVPAFVELVAAAVEDNIGQVCADSTISHSAEQDDDALTPQLIDWLRDNGAYINEKLAIKQLDPSFPRGIYALEDMEMGETVCKIPWSLILKPNDYEHVHVVSFIPRHSQHLVTNFKVCLLVQAIYGLFFTASIVS